jgi:xylulokinase
MLSGKINKDDRTYLCFDLGTTMIKSALVDSKGSIIYLDSEKAVSYHDDDSVIQKPEEYYEKVEKQIKKMKYWHGKELAKADSLICSGQMAGILSIDKNWEVVVPWTYSVDIRSNRYLEEIEDSMSSRIRKYSGGVPFMAGKIKWIQKDFPKDYKRSYKFINLTTYVAGRLSGLSGDDAFIDYSVLSMNGLADIKRGVWNRDLIEDLELDVSKLPEITSPYSKIGTIPKEKFKTEQEIKVLAGIGDQVAGFIGAGILKKGDLVDVAGTYTVLGYATDWFIPDTKDMIISSIYSGIEDIYYNMAVVAVGGYLYNWFLEKFGYDDKQIERPSNTEGLYFIPHLGGRPAPSQSYYRGTLYGLKWSHDLDSIYTSMLECIAYEYDFIYSRIKKLNNITGIYFKNIKVIGGGARNNIWNELKANILKLEYLIMEDTSFEIIGNYLIARYGKDVRKGYRGLVEKNIISVLGKVKPEKNKIRYYAEKKVLYKKLVNRIGKIYSDFGKE